MFSKRWFKGVNVPAGIFASAGFLLFVLAAMLSFPGQFSPLNNWISDLGNTLMNPAGNVFLNLGCIVTGMLLLPFFIGLGVWYTEDKTQNILVIAAQFIGVLMAIALMFVGMYPENKPSMHALSAASFFILLIIELIVTTAALYKHPLFEKWLGRYGVLVAILGIVFLLAVGLSVNVIILEWIVVFAGIGWVFAMAMSARKIPVEEPKKEEPAVEATNDNVTVEESK
jgi:hypothetical membrane protein